MFRSEIIRLNTLTEFETLQVTASIWSIFDEKWNCYKCMTSRHFEAYKKVKGCVSTPKTNYQVEGFKINKCLGNFTSREVYSYFEMFKMYERGIMPFGGAMVDQPAKVIDLFNMIEQLKAEKIAELNDKNKKRR